MLWDTAIFRIISESQKDKLNRNPQSPQLNKQLYSFIFRNYFHAQCAYVRRLTDANYGLEGSRGVYSLDAIRKNLKNYREELTREKYLYLRGLPYDYSKIREKGLAFILNQPPRNEKFILIPNELDWERIEDAHETFDRLSDTNPDNRKPSDLIKKQILERLEDKLKDCEKINIYVNKFIAHAATTESRSKFEEDEYKPTLKKLYDAQKIIYQVANFLSGVLFSIDNMPLAIESPFFYEFWDEPFFEEEESKEKVRATLKLYREETETWRESSINDVWSWVES